jgi:hypothetical protein
MRRTTCLSTFAVVTFLFTSASYLWSAEPELLTPVSAFTTRLIGRPNVTGLVGAPDGAEGTAWRSFFLSIKEDTPDRVVLEYDISGRSVAPLATLNLKLANIDAPHFTPIFMYSFEGNGLANAADFFRLDNFITTFTDNGLADNFVAPYYLPVSLDITSAYNHAINNQYDFLGIVLRNTASEQLVRYGITNIPNGNIIEEGFDAYPELIIGVPEPSAILYSACAALMLLTSRKLRKR